MTQKYLFETFGELIERKSNQSLESLSKDDILQRFRMNGALVLRGFDANLESFKAFSDQFSIDHFRHGVTKLRNQLSDDGTVVDVLAGTHHVDLHGEMYYLPKQPDILWLMCQQPANQGGATTVCDGVRYLKILPPKVRQTFEQKKILYKHRWNPQGWQSIFRTQNIETAMNELRQDPRVCEIRDENGFLAFNYVTSAIVKPKYKDEPAFINSIANIKQYSFLGLIEVLFEDGSPISDQLLNVINECGEEVTFDLNWQAGDILMVENSRILHGRRAFAGDRKISTRFSRAA